MTGYCLKIESVDSDGTARTEKMIDLRDFIVNNRVPLSDVSVLFAKEIQELLCKRSRQGFIATQIQVQEKYASLTIAKPSGCKIEYRLWFLRTSFNN